MFPECFHRGQVNPNGRYPCKHPGLHAATGVSEAECSKCLKTGIYCNQPPKPHHLVRPRLPETDCQKFSCQHRGKPHGFTPCQLCGGDGKGTKLVLLFECHLNPARTELCTINAAGVRINGAKAAVCVACPDRQPES